MKRASLLISGLMCSLLSFSQTVLIIDNEEKRPVANVDIYNQSRSLFTSTKSSGKAEIGVFGNDGIICFHHFSYERVCLTAEEIKKAGYTIILTRKTFPIEEFVISANRWEQERNEVPNKISVISGQLIDFRDPQTSADLIASSDEVFVQKSQLGGGSPMIRGFSTNRVLIVIDGVRMNNAIYREGNIQNILSVDPSAIESTEIIFGPGAVVYGSDAIGGVMDFHTRKAHLASGDKLLLRAEAMTRYSTANNEKSFNLNFNAGGKKVSLMSGISFSDFDDLRMGSKGHTEYLRHEYAMFINGKDSVFANPDPEKQIFSGYSQVSSINKLRIKVSDNIDLTYSNLYSSLSDVPRYDRLIQYRSGKLRYGDWYYGPQVWMLNNLRFSFSNKNALYDNLRLTVARQDYRESRHDRSFGKSALNEQFEKLLIYSVNLDLDKKLSEKDDLLYYGLEYVFNDIKSTARTRDIISGITEPAGSRYPNGLNRYNCFSVYAGFKRDLSEKIILNTGLRYNYADLRSTIADNSYYGFPFTEINTASGALTGSGGIVWKNSRSARVTFNASTGFRAPNLDDAGKVFESAPGIVIVPNPDLKAEYAVNFDLGYTRNFGSLLHLEASSFCTWLKNAMVRSDFLFNGKDSIIYGGELSRVEAIVNASYALVYGINLGIRINFTGHLSLKSSLNITEGHEKGGIPLRHAPPPFGSSHLIYESSIVKADLYASYNGARKYEDMPPSEISKPYMYAIDNNGNPWSPGWYTINFRLALNLIKRATFNAGIENILDHRYRPYSSGIVSPGRNFVISLRIKV